MSAEHPTIEIVVRGPQGAGKTTVAAAIREMLVEADIAAAIVSAEEPEDVDKAIEQLHVLRGRPRVLISTEQSSDHRRDIAVANAVLAALRACDVPTPRAFDMARRIVDAIEHARRGA